MNNKMAAPIKRQASCTDKKDTPQIKKAFTDNDNKLDTFLKWCSDNDFNLSEKVQVRRQGSCAQYGMVAVQDIVEDYCLFQIPRKCILMPENSRIAESLKRETENLSESNQWIPLLISLIHEHSDDLSKWKPYLDLCPDPEALDLPMFWHKNEVESHLSGTGVDLLVERDSKTIKEDFHNLVKPFFEKYSEARGDKLDFDLFRKMVAFVMAYSFNEPAGDNEDDPDEDEDEEESQVMPPMMVPMADLLNHVTDNNAKLTFGTEALKMVTTRPIKQGEEVFNTYGHVSNLHLMHMYGFAENYPDNTNDVVEIPATTMLQAAQDLENTDQRSFLKEKWKFLEEQEMVSDDEIFVTGPDGIITDDVCCVVLKVMCLTRGEFERKMEEEGWSDAESESSLSGDSRLSLEAIPELHSNWKKLLARMAEIHLSKYPSTIEEDKEKFQIKEMSQRARYSLYTAHGQKKILSNLIDACNTT